MRDSMGSIGAFGAIAPDCLSAYLRFGGWKTLSRVSKTYWRRNTDWSRSINYERVG
jgi:hypothetical protein